MAQVVWCKRCGEGTVQGLCRAKTADEACEFRAPPTAIQRLQGLAELEPGWDKGRGRVPSPAGLQWLAEKLAQFWPDVTPDAVEAARSGNPVFTWNHPDESTLSLTFDLEPRRAWVCLTGPVSGTLSVCDFDLAHERGWLALICQVTGDPTAGRQIGLLPE